MTKNGGILMKDQTWSYKGCKLYFNGTNDGKDVCPPMARPVCYVYNGSICCAAECAGIDDHNTEVLSSYLVLVLCLWFCSLYLFVPFHLQCCCSCLLRQSACMSLCRSLHCMTVIVTLCCADRVSTPGLSMGILLYFNNFTSFNSFIFLIQFFKR